MRTATKQSQRRRLAVHSERIVELAREGRKSLLRVVDLVSARHAEFLTISDNGAEPVMERRPLNSEERVEYLQHALTWVQKTEDWVRQLRAAIEKALEKEWKHL